MGNVRDRNEWHNLVAWQRTAELVGEYVKKGSKIYVEGTLRTSSWTDKNSNHKKYRTEIVVNELVLLSGSDDSGARAEAARQYSRSPESDQITDDDIPF
jgi:single-strand DNA-binding protein